MAGGEERILRRRIKSVNSTKKITRAMELIAATRIVKAQQRVAAARPYAEQITAVIQSLASAGAGRGQPLLTPRDQVRRVAYVVIAGDRGLAGAYNSSVIRLAERTMLAGQSNGTEYSIIAVGKKVEDYFKFRKYHVDAAFKGFTDSPTYENARAIGAEVLSQFESGAVDQVELVYTQFLSAGSQRPRLTRFMPIEIEAPLLGESAAQADYEYEPEPNTILGSLLPRYVESRLFAALLDAAASEHAGRQRAMKSATENAGELVKKLSRQMNTARQAAITTEIMEIVGGAEALNDATSGGSDLIADRTGAADFFHSRVSDSVA